MAYTHDHITTQEAAFEWVETDEFERLLDGSITAMLGGTLTYEGVGEIARPPEVVDEAQMRRATKHYFKSYAEDRGDDTYLTRVYKDGHCIAAHCSVVEGADWVLCQSLYGGDVNGSKSWWRDPAYHKYIHDQFKALGCTHWVSYFEENSYFNDRVAAFGTDAQVWDFTDELFDYGTAEHEFEPHTYQIEIPSQIPIDSVDETFGEADRVPATVQRFVKPQYRYRIKYKDWD
jgi:hypothetical protein